MNKPDLSKAPAPIVEYIDHLEQELKSYRSHPLSNMYEVWSRKLNEIVDSVDEAPIAVETEIPGLEDTGVTAKVKDVDPFGKIKKVLSVMNEAKPTVETIGFLRQKLGIKEEVKTIGNPIEDRAQRRKK